MKTLHLSLFLFVLLLAAAAPASSDVSVRLGIGVPARRYYYGSREPWYNRRYPHYRRAYVAPVVVAPSPYYGGYAYPVYTPPPPPPPAVSGLSSDYATNFANLNEKLSRLRAVVHRQNQSGSISQEQYNRFMNTLEGVEHDEHARAYDRGGDLADEDFADLYRRLDQASEDIEIALAQ